MEIAIAPTVVPKEIDPSSSEARRLGAQIAEAGFRPLFGS